MATLTLAASLRTASGRHVRALRREGTVPAVLYGHRVEPSNICADERALRKIWRSAGRTHLISLSVDGGQPCQVLFRDFQIDPRTARPLHADFFVVNLLEKLTADIPIVLVGEAPAVTDLKLGQLLQTLSSVRVECLPADLPAQLNVDVTGLTELDASLTLADVELPKGVTIVADLGEMIVKVAAHRVQAAEEPTGAEADSGVAAAPADGGVAAGGEQPSSG